MEKNKKLNQWLWKWHFIAGMISLPFVLVLAITGGIYLFKDEVEQPHKQKIQMVDVVGTPISYQEQWRLARDNMHKEPNSIVLPTTENSATEFVAGRFSHKTSLFVNPYTAGVAGTVSPQDTWMYTVRKLHGELLGGKVGTKLVELVASWMVVLILTGIYIFWPSERGWLGFLRIRTRLGKRVFYRDLHAVTGFWASALLLITLAGGFPWTDVFGESFKQFQRLTNTGFPKEWHGVGLRSKVDGSPLSLDEMIAIAKDLHLEGVVSLDFPKGETGVFSVHNETFPLENQKKIHFDQYSGKQMMVLNWNDVGIAMRARMWLMAFHQGQLGGWNFFLMLMVAVTLTVMILAGLSSFVLRKRKGDWGIPRVPRSFKAGYGVVAVILVLGILFPLFGISLLLIALYSFVRKRQVRELRPTN